MIPSAIKALAQAHGLWQSVSLRMVKGGGSKGGGSTKVNREKLINLLNFGIFLDFSIDGRWGALDSLKTVSRGVEHFPHQAKPFPGFVKNRHFLSKTSKIK